VKKLLVFCTTAALMLTATASYGALVAPDGTLETLGIVSYEEGGTATLPEPGDYEWWYGCSPTAAGMLIGYYDVQGYNGQSYGNLVPGGQAEDNTYDGSDTYLANNAIASSGHINDFYSGGYGASGDDVVPPTHEFDCLADFMGTSQDDYDNSNGATTFYFYTDNNPLTASKIYEYGPEYYNSDGMYGIGEYINYAGYDTAVLYSQFIYGYEGISAGFTFEQYMAEIDAGRPVLIHVDNHSMFGYGYDAATNTVLLHDTWSLGQHSMTWGGSYEGLDHYGVTVLTLVPEPATITMLLIGSLVFIKNKNK
jgi:hypothetical protein